MGKIIMKKRLLQTLLLLSVSLSGCKATAVTSSVSSSSKDSEKTSTSDKQIQTPSSSSSASDAGGDGAKTAADYETELEGYLSSLANKSSVTLTKTGEWNVKYLDNASGEVKTYLGSNASNPGVGILKRAEGFFNFTVASRAVVLEDFLTPNTTLDITEFDDLTPYDFGNAEYTQDDAKPGTFTSDDAILCGVLLKELYSGYATIKNAVVNSFTVSLTANVKDGFKVSYDVVGTKSGKTLASISFTLSNIGSTTDAAVTKAMNDTTALPAPTAFPTASSTTMAELTTPIPLTGLTYGMAYQDLTNSDGDTVGGVIMDYASGDISSAYNLALLSQGYVAPAAGGTTTAYSHIAQNQVIATHTPESGDYVYCKFLPASSLTDATEKKLYTKGVFLIEYWNDTFFELNTAADITTYFGTLDYKNDAKTGSIVPLPGFLGGATSLTLYDYASQLGTSGYDYYATLGGAFADQATAITDLNAYLTTLAGLGYVPLSSSATEIAYLSTSVTACQIAYKGTTYSAKKYKGFVVAAQIDTSGNFQILFAE
jgi:hypothetical protein